MTRGVPGKMSRGNLRYLLVIKKLKIFKEEIKVLKE